ncbi:unnamed protein product [Rangifer tarandus platyrhynchus]|uniref:Uncharacterized protein n=1 Tax=Rangifer tarandus platyrhynchus TaxID=3082113 RepID=A0ABN9A666_RANTA|nr:unnamed protein product [Rangifer tarandus platyrhynchus]
MLSIADADDSKLVLLSALGSVFCCGLVFLYSIQRLPDDHKRESARMAKAIRNFVNTCIQFKKPNVVAVNGPAIGLGASILPLCDVVWANEKAWFQTSYTTFGESPDGVLAWDLHPGSHARIKELASCNPFVLEESKALVHCNMRLELDQANRRECEVLKKIWGPAQVMDSMLKYVKSKIDEF